MDGFGIVIFLAFVGFVGLMIALGIRKQQEDDDSEWVDDDRSTPLRLFAARTREHDPPTPHIISWETSLQMLQEAHHIGVLGATGDGKTTMGEALLRMLKGQCLIIDPNWEPGKWGGLSVATVDNDGIWGPIADALRQLDTEISRRRIMVREGAGDAARSPLTVLWDEPNETIEELGDLAGAKLRRWLRGARQFGVKLILFPQSDRVEALGLSRHGDARRNLLWVYLGDDARRLIAKEVKAKRMDDAMYDAVIQMQRPGVLRYHEDLYLTNMAALMSFTKGAVDRSKAWGGGIERLSPPPAAESMPPLTVSGIDDLDLFTALARLAQSNVVSSETRMIETVFRCSAGSGKVYQTAVRRLRNAKEQRQEEDHAGREGHYTDTERTDRTGSDFGDSWQRRDVVGSSGPS